MYYGTTVAGSDLGDPRVLGAGGTGEAQSMVQRAVGGSETSEQRTKRYSNSGRARRTFLNECAETERKHEGVCRISLWYRVGSSDSDVVVPSKKL